MGVQAGCAVPIRSPAAPEYHSSALSVRVRRSRVLIRQVWVRDRSFLVPDGKVVTIGCILTCGRHRARVGEERWRPRRVSRYGLLPLRRRGG